MSLPDMTNWSKILNFGDGAEAKVVRMKTMVEDGHRKVKFEMIPSQHTVKKLQLDAELTEDNTIYRTYPADAVFRTADEISLGMMRGRWIAITDFDGRLTTELAHRDLTYLATIRRLEQENYTLRRHHVAMERQMEMLSITPIKAATIHTNLLKQVRKAGNAAGDEEETEEEDKG